MSGGNIARVRRISTLTSSARFRGLSGVVDQIFSSLSNGLIIYAVAVVSTANFFGLISVQLTMLAAALGIVRGALGTSLLLKAGESVEEIRREGSYAITAALIVSPFLAGLMFLLRTDATTTPTIILAIVTPFVLVQDVLRYVVITEGRPHIAALWDGVWFLGAFGLLVCTWFDVALVDVNVLIGGWGLLAFAALLGLGVSARIMPRVGGFVRWLRTDGAHRFRYGVDSGLDQLSIFVMFATIAILVSPVVTAALRGATALLAPISVLTSALPLVVITESARRSSTPKQVWSALLKIGVPTAGAALLTGLIFLVLPDSVGTLLLGDTFELTQQIIFWITLHYAIGGWTLLITLWLKTFNRSSAMLTLKIVYTAAVLIAAVGAALLFREAVPIAVAMVVASTLVAVCGFACFAPWRNPAPSSDHDSAVEAG